MSTALELFRAAPVQDYDFNEIRLRYRTFGSGPAVLFLHGWPLNGATYRYLIEALAPNYCCYVPDLPGSGNTAWSERISDTMTSYTELMRGFVAHLQLESLALIGHDSGGGVARLLAAELGPRVRCLILQNTEVPDYISPLVRTIKLSCQAPFGPTTLGRLLRSPLFRRSLLGFGSCFGDRSLIEGEFLEACVAPLRETIRDTCAALSHLNFGWIERLPEAHSKIEAPIHMFWGGDDPFFPLTNARTMAQTFRHPGELQVIPKAKLFVHEEAPEALTHFSRPLLERAFAETTREPNSQKATTQRL